MRPTALLFGVLTLATGLAVVPAWGQAVQDPSAGDEAVRERQQLVSRLDHLRDEATATEARIRTLGDDLVDVAGDEAKLDQQLEATGASVRALEQRIADEELALEALTGQQALLRQELAAKRTDLAVVLMALQRIGRRPPPALFSDSGGATQAIRGAILLNAVLPTLDANAQQLVRSLSEAARLAADERSHWANLHEDLSKLTGERARLGGLAGELERRRALSIYEQGRAAADLVRLSEEADSVAALLGRVTREGPARPPVSSGFEGRRGNLANPVAGSVISVFGEPIRAGGLSEGLTVAALPDATVFAPMDGTVLFSSEFRGYGRVLILDAGDGYHLVLGGLADSSMKPGDHVATGVPLGRMGRSGSRSAIASAGVKGSALLGARPALYIELRKDGSAIDSHGWWREAAADGGRTGG